MKSDDIEREIQRMIENRGGTKMNERIKELAEQAGCKVMDDGEWYIPSATGIEKIVYTKGIGLEKFAELLVKECCAIVHSKTDESIRVVMAIEQHFGVEE